jgi:predicted metal-dependent RNase
VRPRWLSKSAFEHLGFSPDDPDAERELEDAIVGVLDPNVAPTRRRAANEVLRPLHRWVDRREPIAGHHVVLASSGMLEGGPVAAYLGNMLRDASATLLLPGYASPSTLAGELLQVGSLPAAERARLAQNLALPDGTTMPAAHVRAHIGALRGYSGHADQRGILDWLVHEHKGQRCVAGETIFIQHGNDTARHALRDALKERAPEATVVCPTPACADFDLDGEQLPSYEALLARYRRAD